MLLTALGLALCTLYGGVMAWRGGVEALRMTAIREVWETAFLDLEVWPSRWFVPLGCLVMGLVFLVQALDRAYFAASGSQLRPERGQLPLH